MPINRGGNAVTAEFFNICHAAAVDFLSVGLLQTLADGMRGRAFGQRRIFEQLCFVHRAVMNGRDLKHAARQRTGLVENNDLCFGQGLQIVGALDQNALFAGPPIPAKKLNGMLMTNAHGQLTTRNDSAR